MASADDNGNHLSRFLHSASINFPSLFTSKSPSPPSTKLHIPLLAPNSFLSLASPYEFTQPDSLSSTQSRTSQPSSSAIKNRPSDSASGFPSPVRISASKGGGPAFVGQVFSMCDLSGTGLMAVSTHFDIPFLSKRTPEWLKKMFASVTKSERNGPVFRFFMDLGDAVSYVKRLNIPSGVVGACRLDIAYEHFKEKPHLFQFIANENQVKEANKLLKTMLHRDRKKKVEGVPVFSAQNLDIAIATSDGIKWYTPYFFDKNMLDNILEESADQHFHSLIQTRHLQRQRDIVDDNLAGDVIEEMTESMLEHPEIQEVLDEMSNPGILLSAISKAAEIQLQYGVDKILLGNRWLRKASGIQPKFPYVVDSFERRSAASFMRAHESSNFIADSSFIDDNVQNLRTSEVETLDKQGTTPNFRFPFGDWSSHPWSKQQQREHSVADRREVNSTQEHRRQDTKLSPFIPKVTMVGVSTGESGQMSKTTLRKTMDELTKELERVDEGDPSGCTSNEFKFEERDPLFVANVGDYYSGVSNSGSARWVRGRSN
ncbi:U1 small nuclear ribonucleo component SNU71 [Olea europaea subsp. europaea]|uniref:U1 small nuclear ribonucleo component SNU71 n=1 Tax=Olea europaea subsp. europaea TaxID=158383 RepID=A0A8S0S462_OLEEU|nr:U1 small nuclear ribonucleo component SNU71 [Olea europaea subsp. europaea]